MSETPSSMTRLRMPALDFDLPDTTGQAVRLADFADKPELLVAF